MSTNLKNVAIAGATGALGKVVLDALLNSVFNVTALVRPESTSTFPPGVKTAAINYSDPSTLASALHDQDVLISCVGYAGILSQAAIIDAAIAAGVQRIIPSEFGSDQNNALARALPVFGHKVQIEHHLREAVEGTATTWTLVANNEFLDWDLDHGFGVDIAKRRMEIFDGGDVPFTATPLSYVAEGMVSILNHPDETANQIIRLHGTSLTQNHLLSLLQRFTETTAKDWEITYSSTEEREKEAYSALASEPEKFEKWAVMMLQCAVWGRKFGNDFSGRNENEMLGLRELSDGEVEEIVKARC